MAHFFAFFHALSFELNYFFDRSFPFKDLLPGCFAVSIK